MALPSPSALLRDLNLAILVGFGSLSLLATQAVHGEDSIAAAGDMPQAVEMGEHAHHHHAAVQALSRTTATYAIPDVMLTDQTGQVVSLRSLLDSPEPVLLNFIFTSCTAICPVMSGTFAQVQRDLGPDAAKVRMVSISIDPEHDTPAELIRYAKRFDAGPQWSFLTGRPNDIVAVQRAFDAFRGDKMNHTPLTLLRPSPQAQWVRYDGFAGGADLAKEARGMMGS